MWLLLACTASGPPTGPDAPRDTGDTAGVPHTGDTSDDTESADTTESTDSADDSAPDTSDTSDTGGAPAAGPCATYAPAVAVGEVADPALNELSGLAVSQLNPGILWTHEDSGGAPELYALDTTGATVATLQLEGVENEDWEDLAIGPCGDAWCLVVGDIGTLGTSRSEFALLVVEEPLLDGTATLSATPEVRPFTYPGDPEDAEALVLEADGTAVIVTKRENATAGVYRLPAGATVLEWVSEIATGAYGEDLAARVTAADLWHDPARLLVRTYFHLYEFDVADLAAPIGPTTLDYAFELQGEAVAYDPLQGGFWQVSEGVGPALNYTGCAP